MSNHRDKLASVMAKADHLPAIKALGKRNSKRAKQRAVALFLMHLDSLDGGRGYVAKYDMERALIANGVMNRANFTQNMKKDSNENPKRDLWTINWGYGRGPGGWTATEKGLKLAKIVFDAVNETYARIVESIKNTFKVTLSRILCPYCQEEVAEDTDAIKCDGCGVGSCYSCWIDTGRGNESRRHIRCFNASTTARCHGAMKVLAKPENFVPHVAEKKCETCKGEGWGRQCKPGIEGFNSCRYGCRHSAANCPTCDGTGEWSETAPKPKPKAPKKPKKKGPLVITITARPTET